jgi:hypothetical protein
MSKVVKTLFGIIFSLMVLGAEASPVRAGVSIYANNGNYYTEYGPSQYWWTANNEGFCGRYGTCSPTYMRWTYGCSGQASNYGYWDNIDNNWMYAYHDVFIPRVNATSKFAPYTLGYGGGSSLTFRIDQSAYYDAWVRGVQEGIYDLRITTLSDATQEACAKKVGFDEIKITI